MSKIFYVINFVLQPKCLYDISISGRRGGNLAAQSITQEIPGFCQPSGFSYATNFRPSHSSFLVGLQLSFVSNKGCFCCIITIMGDSWTWPFAIPGGHKSCRFEWEVEWVSCYKCCANLCWYLTYVNLNNSLLLQKFSF